MNRKPGYGVDGPKAEDVSAKSSKIVVELHLDRISMPRPLTGAPTIVALYRRVDLGIGLSGRITDGSTGHRDTV